MTRNELLYAFRTKYPTSPMFDLPAVDMALRMFTEFLNEQKLLKFDEPVDVFWHGQSEQHGISFHSRESVQRYLDSRGLTLIEKEKK